MSRPIALLTDFGLDDTYVAQMKAVIVGICPDAPIIDLSHSVRPHDVEHGAFLLETALPVLPVGSIVVAVVDPAVGTSRAAALLRTQRHVLLGPDNGILYPHAASLRGGGQRADFYRLDQPRHWLKDVSTTFHGRDIFAPVAAHLAGFADDSLSDRIAALGSSLPDPVPATVPRATAHGAALEGEVIHVDRFGNLITNIRGEQMSKFQRPTVTVRDGQNIIDMGRPVTTYAGYDELIAIVGSAGYLELALPAGSAANFFGRRTFTIRIQIHNAQGVNRP